MKKANQLHEQKLKLAMALLGKNKHYAVREIHHAVREIHRDHFNRTARACGFGGDMNALIDATVEATPRAIERVGKDLPEGFPAKVFDTITAGMTRAGRSL